MFFDEMMFSILVYVPTIRPNAPISIRHMFFANMIFFSVGPSTFQKAHNCMIAGNASPRPDRQNAPNSDMKRSNSGIDIASPTATSNED
jgi:hypothetical protein